MGVASGCGCKEVYRFPHTTYPYSSCICSFLQQHPYFLFIKKRSFLFLFQYFFIIKFYVLNNFFEQYKHTYGRLRASHGSYNYEGLHIMFYTRRSTYKRTFLILRWTSAYYFKERGVDLEVEGVHYIEMHRRPAAYVMDRLLQGAEISN